MPRQDLRRQQLPVCGQGHQLLAEGATERLKASGAPAELVALDGKRGHRDRVLGVK